MKYMTAALFAAFLGLNAPAADIDAASIKKSFDELLPKMAMQDAQQKWQEVCFQLGAPGNEALRTEACKLMIDKLDAKTPNATRIWLLKQLQQIGRAECIDAVAGLIDEKDELVRDAAVRCLANNPDATATTKLLERLPGAKGKARVGLINALGHRGDNKATDLLTKELINDDTAVAIAAAKALARIATPEAAKGLTEGRGKVKDAVRLAVSDASMRHADRLLKEGKIKEASAIYKELNTTKEPGAIRLAAIRGELQAAGDDAGAMILDLLTAPDLDARAIAVAEIESLSGGALKALAGKIDKLPTESQVLVLNGLAARGEKSQMSVALAAAQNPRPEIRRAGIEALGRLGDASVVPALVNALHPRSNLSDAAADSLAQLGGDGVNEKLVTALASDETPARQVALIAILERRRATVAVPALLSAAVGKDGGVRTSAFAALRTVAEPKHVGDMISALLKIENPKDREPAELAIVAVCSQIANADQRAEAVLAALDRGSKGTREALLPLLGRLGGEKSLSVVRDALNSDNAALYEAGVTGLCNWPDPKASEDLLRLAKEAKDMSTAQRAVRAVVRVNGVLTDYPAAERLANLKKAMNFAVRDEERRLVLEGLGFVRHIESLRFVVGYLDNKDLAQATCKGVVELAHSKMLREPNREEFHKALDRVIAICKDKGLVDRAKQYKEGR